MLSATSLAENKRVVIGCTPGLSHLILIHQYRRLRQAIGQDVSLGILTLEPIGSDSWTIRIST